MAKMKKKIIAVGLSVVGLALVFVSVLNFLGLFKPQDAGLTVDSDPQSKVFVDGVEKGATPFELSTSPKEVSLKLVPEDNTLDDYETKVSLVPGVRTIVKRSFRKTDDLTSGAIVSFERAGSSESLLAVVSYPDNAQIKIDGRIYGYTPLRVVVLPGDHDLVVSQSGYMDKSLKIKVYKGYKLTASVKLGKNEQEETEEDKNKVEESDLGRIKINKTDTGFLRVREGAGTGFPEVAQVKPNEVYKIIEIGERGKWYKIAVPQKTNTGETQEIYGWVSADFVAKLQ